MEPIAEKQDDQAGVSAVVNKCKDLLDLKTVKLVIINYDDEEHDSDSSDNDSVDLPSEVNMFEHIRQISLSKDKYIRRTKGNNKRVR